jgi:hypothetical protein
MNRYRGAQRAKLRALARELQVALEEHRAWLDRVVLG